MKNKIKLFLPIVLICSLLIGQTCFAMEEVGSFNALSTFWNNITKNQTVLKTYSQALPAEKQNFIKKILPTVAEKMGYGRFITSYDFLNTQYNSRWRSLLPYAMQVGVSTLEDWQEFKHDYNLGFVGDDLIKKTYWQSQDVKTIAKVLSMPLNFYGSDETGFYQELSEYIITQFYYDENSNDLNAGYGFSQAIYNIVSDLAEKEIAENGVQFTKVYSYKNINSSVFGNVTNYNNFINKCNTYKSNGFTYVVMYTGSSGNYTSTTVIGLKGDLVRNGATGKYSICTYAGSLSNVPTCWGQINNSNIENYNRNLAWNMNLGSPSSSIPYYLIAKDGITNGSFTFTLYSLDDDVKEKQVFTSLNGYINNKGHYEPSIVLPNYIAPSVSYNAQDMVTTYNYMTNYEGTGNPNYNNQNNNVNNINISVPDTYQPAGNNGYDKESHTLKFDGISSLLSSIGSLLGSLINGIAQGIANIVTSLVSVVTNMVNFFGSGSQISELLSSFMSWIPAPIPQMLVSLFGLAVIFGLIKLIKGAL